METKNQKAINDDPELVITLIKDLSGNNCTFNKTQVYLGLYKHKDGRNIWCSITKDSDTVYEWFCQCDHGYLNILCESMDTTKPTYQECYNDMIRFMNSFKTLPKIIYFNINSINGTFNGIYKMLGIKDDFKQSGFVLGQSY